MQDIDRLTRLPNREAFLERLDDEIARAERYGPPLSLLLADVNGFEALQSSRGGDTGDAVLRQLALTFLSTAREGDTVARVGEDRFAMLLPDTDRAGAVMCAERFAGRASAADLSEDDTPLFVTLSIGIATFDSGVAESAALMVHAQEALETARKTVSGAGEAKNVVYAFPEGDASSAER